MTKEELIGIVSEKMRDIRTEAGYSQDRMAEIIGLSKKTLVQIEKGRAKAGWSTVVTVCALFRETVSIRSLLGSDALEVLETIARDGIDFRKQKTLGGKIWWREIARRDGYILQQNMLSSHYRILDSDYYRIYSSFDEQAAMECFHDLNSVKNKN
ncbi:helix-turn-helix domain-containing protein [Bacillus marasmi]|uniref:helix-turn-helix domain-containing protein n=1 Tax=Bacillus marasmi TaxID=1926279 RepID=UPI0011C8EE60|nr:helix-turn-helix domain-containing protein [Bacillus marasmi]